MQVVDQGPGVEVSLREVVKYQMHFNKCRGLEIGDLQLLPSRQAKCLYNQQVFGWLRDGEDLQRCMTPLHVCLVCYQRTLI